MAEDDAPVTSDVDVRLLRLPVSLHARASAHGDALQREMELIRRSDPDGDSTPQRLHALVERITGRFGGLGEGLAAELADAHRRGEVARDVSLTVPVAVGAACTELLALLDEVDEYCRRGGELLTLTSPPDIVAYRTWFLGEIASQVAGAGPTPWTGVSAAGEVHHAGFTVDDGPPPVIVVHGDLDLATAPELRAAVAELRHRDVREMVVDLRGAGIVDSVGLSVIVAAHARMAEEGGVLRLRVARPLRGVLELTGLAEVLDVEP